MKVINLISDEAIQEYDENKRPYWLLFNITKSRNISNRGIKSYICIGFVYSLIPQHYYKYDFLST